MKNFKENFNTIMMVVELSVRILGLISGFVVIYAMGKALADSKTADEFFLFAGYHYIIVIGIIYVFNKAANYVSGLTYEEFSKTFLNE